MRSFMQDTPILQLQADLNMLVISPVEDLLRLPHLTGMPSASVSYVVSN